MTDTQIVLQAFLQVIKNFLPAIIFFIVGLAVLAVEERRERNARSKTKTKTSPTEF